MKIFAGILSNTIVLNYINKCFATFLMSLMQRRSNGRPTKTQQLQIQKELREYFERGMSAVFTSNKTGINIKTVCHYFNEWTVQLKQIEEKEFVIRQNREKERAIINLEYMVDKMYELLEQIDGEIKNYKKEKKPVPPHLFSSKLQTLSNISSLTQSRMSIGIAPTIDFDIDEYISARRGQELNGNPGKPIKYY